MEKSFLLKRLFTVFLVALFVFPVAHLFFYIGYWQNPLEPALMVALRATVVQSILSSMSCLILGFVASLGLLWVRQKHSSYLLVSQFVALLPGFLPPILVMTLGFSASQSIPLGLDGIVFFHVLMNLGLAAILVESLLLRKTSVWSDLSLVEGVSGWKFASVTLLIALRSELIAIFVFFFIFFFTSFSVPFLLGGAHYGGIEVFLYEKIFLYNNWGQATAISLLMTLGFFLFGFFFRRYQSQTALNGESLYRHRLAQPAGLFALLAPIWLLAYGWLRSLVLTAKDWTLSGDEIFTLSCNTLLLGVGTGLAVFILGSILVYCFFSQKISNVIFFFVPPGWMVIAFSFFLLPGDDMASVTVKAVIAMAIIFTPFLYRFGLHEKIDSLRDQVDVARVMGQEWNKIFLHILWPQTLSLLAFISGLAAIWACGDFAITNVLFSGDLSLALQMKNYLLNYRLQSAYKLVPILSLVILIVFIIFQGLAYVCREKNY